MPSPFPGMDPYLERPGEWAEFHNDLIQRIKLQLSGSVPSGYRARSEVDLFIHEPPASDRILFGRADDAVVVAAGGGGSPAASAAVAPAPMLRMPGVPVLPEYRHRYLEIRDKDGERVVTVIELLSPVNKNDERPRYLAKQRALAMAGINLLQIDLLRGGRRLLTADAPPHDYDAMLLRRGSGNGAGAEVWLWSVRDPIPLLPVPLGEGDADVALDLRAAFDGLYDGLGLDRFIYARPPEPPLSDDDAAWAAGLLREAGVPAPAA